MIVSEKWMQLALEGTGDGYWQFNFDTREIYFSPLNKRLIGFEPDEFPDDVASWQQRIHPDDMDECIRIESDYRNGRISTHHYEYRVLHASGKYIWLLDRGRVVERHPDGRPLWTAGILTDIDREKTNEIRSRDRSDLLASLLISLQSGILLEDEHRKIQLVNQPFCELFGVPMQPTEMHGMDCSQTAEQVKHLFLRPDDFVSGIDLLLQKKEKRLGEVLPMKDGRVLLRDFIPIWQGNQYAGHLWNYVDISNYAQREELETEQTINYFLTSMLDKEEVADLLDDVARNVVSRLHCSQCAVYYRNNTESPLTCIAAYKQDGETIFPADLAEIKPAAGKLVERAAGSGLIQYGGHTSHPNLPAVLTEIGPKSQIAVPVLLEGMVIGMIYGQQPVPYFFSQRQVQVLSTVANLSALKIKQARYTAQQKDAIERQRKFFEKILNNIPADIAVFDRNHHYLFVNPRGVRDEGIRNWIIGKRDEDYCLYRNKPMTIAIERRKRFEAVLNHQRQVEWEDAIQSPNGDFRHFLRKMYPVLDGAGTVDYVIGYGIEITERKQIEEKVDRSQKELSRLIRYSLALILTHDLDGKILMANPACYQIHGNNTETLEGRNLLDLLHPDDASSFGNYYLPVIRRKHSVKGVCRLLSKNGQVVYLLYHNYLLTDQKDPSVICFAVDITARIQMEEDLREAKQSAEIASRAKEAFLANMSHEIRTPMNGIVGLANLLAKTRLDHRQQEYLNIIRDAANALMKVVNNVLDIEKIAAGRLELEQEVFRVSEKINMVLASFRHRAMEQSIELHLDMTPDAQSLCVEGDPYKLQQILTNLLGNALKFTPEHGRISISVYVSARVADNVELECCVCDTGIGIAPEDQTKIFEPFVQADAGSKTRFQGTGLGLSICRELVTAQHGRIWVHSIPGKGASFYFRIPYHEVKEGTSLRVSPPTDLTALKGIRVLVAEDTAVNQLLIKALLRQWDCRFELAENGLQALDIFRRDTFDIVLMDIQMPGMDGLEVVREIRNMQDPVKRSIPVIALTAHALKGDLESFLDVGFTDCITKPFQEETLGMAMLRHLNIGSPIIPTKSGNDIDLSRLLSLGGGSGEATRELMESFCVHIPPAMAAFSAAILQGNLHQARSVFHKIKPAIKTICNGHIREITGQLDQYLQQEEAGQDMTALVATFNHEFLRWQRAMEYHLQQMTDREPMETNPN